jgi:acyl-CoA thioesterase II
MAIDLFTLVPREAPGRFHWIPATALLTPNGNLQGGAGLGAALTAMETATGRPTVWATAQYLSYANGTAALDVDVAVEVVGHNTTMARCTVSRDGAEVLTAHAALGARDTTADGVWLAPPDVPAPEDCPPYVFFDTRRDDLGKLAEFRLASGRQLEEIIASGARGTGHDFILWVRCWAGTQSSAVPDLTFIGDFMPVAFADATGLPFYGNSLDNTVRVGRLVETEWILLATHVQQVANGFGYGRAELWAQDGTLLGEVSQSAVLRSHLRGGPLQSSGS